MWRELKSVAEFEQLIKEGRKPIKIQAKTNRFLGHRVYVTLSNSQGDHLYVFAAGSVALEIDVIADKLFHK